MSLDTAIARIAATQHGVFVRSQATSAGATAAQIERRTASGLWVALDRGTYALASSPATWQRTVMAAVLSKTRAFASGMTAGYLHGLPGCPQRWPEITTPFTGNARSPLASVRRRSDFTAIGRAVVRGIPVSSVPETIFDLARTMRRPRLQRAIDHALVYDLVTVDELSAVMERIDGMRLKGTVAFREALAALTDTYVPTESRLEQLLFSVIDVPGIPTPKRQVRLDWWDRLPHRVDALIAPWRLILEADGPALPHEAGRLRTGPCPGQPGRCPRVPGDAVHLRNADEQPRPGGRTRPRGGPSGVVRVWRRRIGGSKHERRVSPPPPTWRRPEHGRPRR